MRRSPVRLIWPFPSQNQNLEKKSSGQTAQPYYKIAVQAKRAPSWHAWLTGVSPNGRMPTGTASHKSNFHSGGDAIPRPYNANIKTGTSRWLYALMAIVVHRLARIWGNARCNLLERSAVDISPKIGQHHCWCAITATRTFESDLAISYSSKLPTPSNKNISSCKTCWAIQKSVLQSCRTRRHRHISPSP